MHFPRCGTLFFRHASVAFCLTNPGLLSTLKLAVTSNQTDVPDKGTRLTTKRREGTRKMQKKALVFAVCAALTVPCAFAQKKGGGGGDKEDADPDQVVELYGKLYPELVRQKGSGATPAGAPGRTSWAKGGSQWRR